MKMILINSADTPQSQPPLSLKPKLVFAKSAGDAKEKQLKDRATAAKHKQTSNKCFCTEMNSSHPCMD